MKKEKCEHGKIIVKWWLARAATLYTPPEYIGLAVCQVCGEEFPADDITDDMAVVEWIQEWR